MVVFWRGLHCNHSAEALCYRVWFLSFLSLFQLTCTGPPPWLLDHSVLWRWQRTPPASAWTLCNSHNQRLATHTHMDRWKGVTHQRINKRGFQTKRHGSKFDYLTDFSYRPELTITLLSFNRDNQFWQVALELRKQNKVIMTLLLQKSLLLKLFLNSTTTPQLLVSLMQQLITIVIKIVTLD